MEISKTPLFRVFLVAVVIAALLFMPAREFLKITFILAIPAIIIIGFMLRQKKYSFTWLFSLVLVLGIGAFYIYNLTVLPDRIEARRIISEGSALMAEGRFDEAREQFVRLEVIGREEKMKQKLEEVEQEQQARQQFDLAREWMARGENQTALEILEKIPPNTRASSEAQKLLREVRE